MLEKSSDVLYSTFANIESSESPALILGPAKVFCKVLSLLFAQMSRVLVFLIVQLGEHCLFISLHLNLGSMI